jgi:hypothetical protein
MARSKLLSLVLGSVLALVFAGCATDSNPGENTGSVNLNLELAEGIIINEVDWTISGGDMDPMSGTIDTSAPGATASVEVFGLPPGEGYLVELEASDESGEVTCRGDAEFDVEVGVATDVVVFLNCKRPTVLGGVRVNGKFNICAQLAKVVVSPLQTSVGNDIDLSVLTIDVEADEVAIVWTATGGSIADSSAEQTTYTCGEVGQQSIAVTISDDDFEYCMDSWAVAVTCVEGDGDLCEGVSCEDDGNECTAESCNPATGQCESNNVDDGTACDGGAGACMAGECVANDLCEGVDCDDQNECTTDLCNPEDGQCSNDPVDDGTSCNAGAGMCVNGDCMNIDLCEGVVCDDTGNECTEAACNPSTGLCETSNVPDGTECSGGAVELAVNGGFETGNLDGWTQFCDGPNNGTCAATMAEASSGAWSGNLVASVPAEGGAPSFPLIKNANIGIGTVTPGAEVTISFDLLGSLAGAGGVVFAEFFSELETGGTSKTEILGGGPIFPTGEWVNYSYTTTAGSDVSGGVTLQLKVDCGASAGCIVDAYFDNVSVTVQSSAGICMEGVCGAVDLCEGVVCDDTGNECTAATCNPSTGLCETSNVPDGTACNGGAGTCNAGVCEEDMPEVQYEQDFESLDQASGTALGEDGWTVFGNAFSPDGLMYLYGYGPNPAPNNSGGFSGIALGQGGVEQGDQQLVIISDYNNTDQAVGNRIEANTYRERPITAADVGKTITFSFDAKRGNINDPADPGCTGSTNPPCDSSALAFIKTLNPAAGFVTTNFITEDTTALPDTWNRYSISLLIDAGLVDQLLQVGFAATASNYEPSGVFYDNVLVTSE